MLPSERHRLVLLAAVVVLSRALLLNPYHGLDPDGFRVVQVAEALHRTGVYEPSRLPGYPVQEIVTSWLVPGGPWLVNLASAIASLAAVLALARALRWLGARQPEWTAGATALAPVVLVNSLVPMDYLWALAGVALALWAVARDRPVLAGLAIGLATGCRITSAAMIVPCLWIDGLRHGFSTRRALRLGLPAVAVALIAYLPVFLLHSWGFFTYYPGMVPLSGMIRRLTLESWGFLATPAIAVAVLLVAWRARPTWQSWLAKPALCGTALYAVVLYVAVFVCVPYDAGYLIPAVPMLLVLLAEALPIQIFRTLAVVVGLSPFVLSIHRDGVYLAGPAIEFQRLAANQGRMIEDAATRIRALPGPALVVAGWLAAALQRAASDRPDVQIAYVPLRTDLARRQAAGQPIYRLPGTEEALRVEGGLELSPLVAPLLVPPPARPW